MIGMQQSKRVVQFRTHGNGGALIQHLPDVVNHEFHTGGTLETYTIEEESKLRSAVGTAVVEGKSLCYLCR